jgi:hypothetical protein
MERSMREARLAERLLELRDELTRVTRTVDISTAVERFRAEIEASARITTALELRDALGRRQAVSAPGGEFRPPEGALRATIEVTCPALESGSGKLAAWQSDDRLAHHRARLWREWTVELVLTSLAVVVVVELAVYVLVGRPLGRLVRGLRRLEHGHLGPIDPGPGGWEIRWLAWRFERLGRELADTARRLVAAERRALNATRSAVEAHDTGLQPAGQVAIAATKSAGRAPQTTLARQYLQDTCRLLETLNPGEPVAREIAEEAWTEAVVEAERVGDAELKARLEDAALRILEHREFAELDAQLDDLRRRRLPWSQWIGDRLSELLSGADIGAFEIQHRVKHTAGVWRKMREAQIDVDQVHDLFAFRIIVSSEQECYMALAAVHRCFEPEPFRFKDYIQSSKANGYRSLHTTVRDADGRLFEVQIRTREMHESAENGRAAHWRYRTERWGSLASLRFRPWWQRRR